jgi:hypothetical protein
MAYLSDMNFKAGTDCNVDINGPFDWEQKDKKEQKAAK